MMKAEEFLDQFYQMQDGDTFTIPISVAQVVSNPLSSPPWLSSKAVDGEQFRAMVQQCLDERKFLRKPWQHSSHFEKRPFAVPYGVHARRVAYLIEFGWNDPIIYNFGIAEFGYFPSHPISDGNHRLYAAQYCGHSSILAGYEGSLEDGRLLFRAAVQELTYRQHHGLATQSLQLNSAG